MALGVVLARTFSTPPLGTTLLWSGHDGFLPIIPAIQVRVGREKRKLFRPASAAPSAAAMNEMSSIADEIALFFRLRAGLATWLQNICRIFLDALAMRLGLTCKFPFVRRIDMNS